MQAVWNHPFTCIISGPTGSGKTYFVHRLIQHAQEMIYPAIDKIIWCYGEWQESYAKYRNIDFREGLSSLKDIDSIGNKMVVIDDLMQESDKSVTQLFVKGSHHRNLSVIFITQNLFNKNIEQRTISLNTQYFILFKNPRDVSQITHIAKQMYPGNVKYLQAAFKDATSEAYGYLMIDCKQETPESLRLRTHIFPGEIQFVYLKR